MKLKKEFLLRNTGSESILVPAGGAAFSGIVRGNKTLGMILELLKEETTEAEIITALKREFNAPEGVIEQDVADILNRLSDIGAIDRENK